MVVETAFQAEETEYDKSWKDGKKPFVCKNMNSGRSLQ